MKKIAKIIGIVLLVLVVLLIAAPFLFKGTIEKAVKKSINKNINATVEWKDLSLSLFSSFPDAQLTLNELSVINKAPFAGDTLATSKSLALDMGIMQLFNGGDEPLSINELSLDEAYINIKVDSLGNANYDIAKPSPEKSETTTDESNDGGLSLGVQHYQIKNSRINYLDEKSKMFLRITDFNHEGTGDFSADKFKLETNTEALVSFAMDSTDYLNKNSIKLDADFEMDLANQKYTFLENKALINQLPLTFDGFVKLNENSTDIDLSFKTPSSDFKNFLGLVPEAYAKNLNGVETTGNFSVNGVVKGSVDDKHIPTLDIAMKSNNASFKYPDLPKKVENISIDAVLKNETGFLKDTYVNLNKLTFKIDQDVFAANGNFKNITENALINLSAKGRLNLANISKAYPLPPEMDMNLNGILNADITTNFDMNSLEKEQYQNIKTSGTASISNFSYESPEFAHKINISTASLAFNPQQVQLKEMKLNTGKTDVSIAGNVQNLMGYMFADKNIKGKFNVSSNTFSVNDFMTSQPEKNTKKTTEENKKAPQKTSSEEAIKIPSFLDVQLDFNAKKVLYDDITLSNAKGTLIIKDEKAILQNITSDIFGGSIALNGNVSTKETTPTFNMKLGLNRIDIVQSFNGMELMQSMAPIAQALQGLLNTDIELKGNLNNDLTPIMNSLAGDAFAQILNAKVDPNKAPLVSKLNHKMSFINLNNLDLKDVKTKLAFNNGNVEVKPFDFNINKDIKVTASGKHSLQNVMDYTLDLNVPAKYLGNEVGGQLAKLSGTDLEKMKVNVPVGITGSFTNPKIQLNLQSAVKEISQQIIEKQKNDLKDKAEEEVKNKINDLLGGNKNDNKDDNKNGNKNNKDDNKNKSTEDKVKDAAKDIMGGLFGDKKK